MKCPKCNSIVSSVYDSRDTSDGANIRRRRICITCGQRYTTYEVSAEDYKKLNDTNHIIDIRDFAKSLKTIIDLSEKIVDEKRYCEVNADGNSN